MFKVAVPLALYWLLCHMIDSMRTQLFMIGINERGCAVDILVLWLCC